MFCCMEAIQFLCLWSQKHVFMPLCLSGNYITTGKLQMHVNLCLAVFIKKVNNHVYGWSSESIRDQDFLDFFGEIIVLELQYLCNYNIFRTWN